MQTLMIEVRDSKGMALLRDLEALDIIRVIDQKQEQKPRAADRFAGKLSAETAKQLDEHIQQSRNEWNRM